MWVCCSVTHCQSSVFLVRTDKPCSSSRPCNLTSTATASRVKEAFLGTAKRRVASLMRLGVGGHAGRRRGEGVLPPVPSRRRCSQKPATNYRRSYRTLTIGLYRKVPVPNLGSASQSARAKHRKVPVDNSLIHKGLPQTGRALVPSNHDGCASLNRRGAVREHQPPAVQLHPCPAVLAQLAGSSENGQAD